jgi:type IV pilus assembly protein PilB
MPELAHEDFEMDALDVSAGEEAIAGDIGEGADVDDAPIVRFVNKVMLDAIRRGASDIHFEPYERAYRIRFRLDGILKEVAAPRLCSPASSPRGSRSCPGSTSPSGASRRTAASR